MDDHLSKKTSNMTLPLGTLQNGASPFGFPLKTPKKTKDGLKTTHPRNQPENMRSATCLHLPIASFSPQPAQPSSSGKKNTHKKGGDAIFRFLKGKRGSHNFGGPPRNQHSEPFGVFCPSLCFFGGVRPPTWRRCSFFQLSQNPPPKKGAPIFKKSRVWPVFFSCRGQEFEGNLHFFRVSCFRGPSRMLVFLY